MPIRIEHGKPSTLLTAAQLAGQARKQEETQKMQMEFDYRQTLRQQDMVIDLQMQERAKQWEIDKMQLRSQIDFQREEQKRQRKLDSYDNVDAELDKQVLSGNVSEEDVKLYRLKNDLARQGMNVSISELRQQQEEDRYGVRPYYLEPEFERDFPELAEAKKKEVISGQRRGTIPYYLDPTFIGNYPEAARQAQEARGILLSDEEFNDLTRGAEPTGLPLGDKQLDVGIRAEQPELIFKGYGRERIQAGEQVGTLDTATARAILTEAGGDRDRARQIARQRGYKF